MASPASFLASSKSTPEIIISEDHMVGGNARLPPPMLSALLPAADSHHPSGQSTPEAKPRSIHFDLKNTPERTSRPPSAKNIRPGSTPPMVIPNKTITSLAATEAGAIQPNSLPSSISPPHLKTRPKLLDDLKRSLSHTNVHHIFHPHHNRPSSRQNPHSVKTPPLGGDSGTTSPLPDTPDLQTLFRAHPTSSTCPNLPAVNRALNALRADSTAATSHPDHLTSLTLLASTLTAARASSRKTLSQAMLARDSGKYEICRALCLGILQDPRAGADVETKVYACAILSTLASKGQSLTFLVEGMEILERACRDGERDEDVGGLEDGLKEKLLVLLAMTKEGAVKRDGGMESEEVRRLAGKVKGLEELRPGVGVEVVGDGVGKLKVPESEEGGSGAVTPRLGRILVWQGWR
ncbi:unnamed protein product [Zymoseptoria tritici ST99CH_1A5]|uniref:Uncharacterized protein n=1 Tax=Zymoseptoria tritici ST99CH_1A5 TaxID=1276529 RepID=A0A1Y6LMW5_ZYMTR|nr:unnamed protein product [Zymoseptoria tritici ST99CH_1A5]